MASAKTRAADDLMAALEDWAATLGDFGVTNWPARLLPLASDGPLDPGSPP